MRDYGATFYRDGASVESDVLVFLTIFVCSPL